MNATYGLNVEAQRINTGSFTDVNQAKETAISIIEGGADVIAPMANDASTGIMEAGEEKGVMAIGLRPWPGDLRSHSNPADHR